MQPNRIAPGPSRNIRCGRALVLIEALAAVGLIVVIVATITIALQEYSKLRQQQEVRRELRLAAETELNRLRIGGALAAPQVSAAPPGFAVELATTRTTGAGDWAGFERVTVIAARKLNATTTLRAELSTYLPAGGGER